MPRLISTGLGRIAILDTQTGSTPVLFLHGMPTSKELFQPLLPLLNPALRAIAIDQTDYGESDKLPFTTSRTIGEAISHKQRADILDEVRQALRLTQFALVAHDLGASVAIDYIAKYGDYVNKLVLMSPPVYPDFAEPAVVKLVRSPMAGELLVKMALGKLLTNGIQRGLVHKETYTRYQHQVLMDAFSGRDGNAAILRNLRWGRPTTTFADYPAIIQAIDTPTLIIHGRHDPYIPLAHARRLRDDIHNAQLLIIENGAHFLPLDTPDILANALNHFLL